MEKSGRPINQEGRRVGSSLVVHDCSSLRLGAASACELEDVNRVNENGFYEVS
jgi:hypothetical protein